MISVRILSLVSLTCSFSAAIFASSARFRRLKALSLVRELEFVYTWTLLASSQGRKSSPSTPC